MSKQIESIANRVFIGLPWNLRVRYDPLVESLMKKCPLEFVIVGKNDRQDAEELLDVIKRKIGSSSYAVFDATNGNANVSLEYGYAEAIGIKCALYLSAYKVSKKPSGAGNIISDLAGKRRNHYKQIGGLRRLLADLAKSHPYTERFERALGKGKRQRTLALKIVRAVSGDESVRRDKLVQGLQADISQYKRSEIEQMLKKLRKAELLTVSRGNRSRVRIR